MKKENSKASLTEDVNDFMAKCKEAELKRKARKSEQSRVNRELLTREKEK